MLEPNIMPMDVLLYPIDYNQVQILNVKEKLLAGWSKRLAKKRDSIHVSDLVGGCRRKVCFERLSDVPPVASEKKIKHFYAGEEKHRNLQSLLGEDFMCEREFVYRTPKGIEIIAHPDAIYKKDGAIVEIKTSESMRPLKEAYPYHIEQLRAYMAILGTIEPELGSYGKLIYMILGYPRTSQIETFFPEYLITFDYTSQRREILEKLEADAIELQAGIDTKDPSKVGHIAKENIFLRFGQNWLCAECPFQERCTEMRRLAGEFKNDEQGG
jgi:CRISPR/Cas system-associated exonuclease Cas4 (RecB family)